MLERLSEGCKVNRREWEALGRQVQRDGTSARPGPVRRRWEGKDVACFDRLSSAGLQEVDATVGFFEQRRRFLRTPNWAENSCAIDAAFMGAVLMGVGYFRGSFLSEEEMEALQPPARALMAACSLDLGRMERAQLNRVRDRLWAYLAEHDPEGYPRGRMRDVRSVVDDLFRALPICSWHMAYDGASRRYGVWQPHTLDRSMNANLQAMCHGAQKDARGLDDLPPFLVVTLASGATAKKLSGCQARPLQDQWFHHRMVDDDAESERADRRSRYVVQGAILDVGGHFILRWAFLVPDGQFEMFHYDPLKQGRAVPLRTGRTENNWWCKLEKDAEVAVLFYSQDDRI
jgi:hypothetical protein